MMLADMMWKGWRMDHRLLFPSWGGGYIFYTVVRDCSNVLPPLPKRGTNIIFRGFLNMTRLSEDFLHIFHRYSDLAPEWVLQVEKRLQHADNGFFS